jgi:hypothetical protein
MASTARKPSPALSPAPATGRKRAAPRKVAATVAPRGPTTPAPAPAIDGGMPLRKPVNTLAIVPKSTRITSLGRKSYNVLLYEAQEQGLDKDVFRAPLERIVKGVDFDSNDHALIKKHLRAMVSTTVEWQSPTTGEGMAWNVSGLLAHARLLKERGQVWVEWSYAVNLKQELLAPTVFARLKLEVISQLRSHAGIALYEICTRYKDVGRTARQHWRWWQPVLSGQPVSERTAKQEYRIFKRDTLKLAIAEVSAITDLEVELAEYKEGRFISEIQFLIRPKKQSTLPLATAPEPVDLSLVQRAGQLGVEDDRAEEMLAEYGAPAFRSGLEALAERQGHDFPAPVRDPSRYLRSLMPGEAERAALRQQDLQARSDASSAESKDSQSKRHSRWAEEWLRRRREQVRQDIESLSEATQATLMDQLLASMEARQVHPSLRKRLQSNGWQHPLVLQEMLRFYAQGTLGDQWDKPTPAQLLAIATEMGDAV